jgi:hypothetical protein
MIDQRFINDKFLMVSLFVVMMMAAVDADIWAGAISGICFIYQILADKKRAPHLSRKVVSFLTLIVSLIVYLKYKTFLGKEPSSTLFLALTGLKILDIRKKSDKQFLVLLGFSLLALRPLFSIDLYWIPPMVIGFFGLWMALFESKINRSRVFLLKIVIASIPISVLMFFIFPRVILPWANDKSSKKTVMGFANQINPGSVADLLERDVLAFRVRFFNDYQPQRKDLYWRGGVLAVTKGLSWYPLSRVRTKENTMTVNTAQTGGVDVRYQVLIEPDLDKILFGLDRPMKLFSQSLEFEKSGSGVFLSKSEVMTSTLYEMTSDLNFRDQTVLDSEIKEKFLQLPQLSERILNFIEKINSISSSDEDKIQKLHDLFSEGGFSYSATPGAYNHNALDEFLFVRKKGFCEHFAASFATLARGLGIPSRVIVGFQGGNYNEIGKFWKITSKDAHAWTEVYINGSWKRIDPTAWVSQLRTEIGSNIYYSLEEEERATLVKNSSLGLKQRAILAFDYIINVFDMLNYKWNTYLIEFDQSTQKEIFKDILVNLTFWRVIILFFFMYAYYVLSRKSLAEDAKIKPCSKLMQDICLWALTKKVERQSFETPIQFLHRVKNIFPLLKEPLEQFQKLYEGEVYLENKNYKNLRKLRRQIKKGIHLRG